MRRPRRDCPVCHRKSVAVMADGSLWWHKWPGYGLWSDAWFLDINGTDER